MNSSVTKRWSRNIHVYISLGISFFKYMTYSDALLWTFTVIKAKTKMGIQGWLYAYLEITAYSYSIVPLYKVQ